MWDRALELERADVYLWLCEYADQAASVTVGPICTCVCMIGAWLASCLTWHHRLPRSLTAQTDGRLPPTRNQNTPGKRQSTETSLVPADFSLRPTMSHCVLQLLQNLPVFVSKSGYQHVLINHLESAIQSSNTCCSLLVTRHREPQSECSLKTLLTLSSAAQSSSH